MNLDFSEEQIMLREMARNFLTDKFPKSIVGEMEASETGYSPETWKEMAELGWMGLAIPEQYGGGGMTFMELAVLLEEMGRACLPGPYFSTVVLGALPILALGNSEQKTRYLPAIAGGEMIVTLALSENNGRYDAAGVQTRAVLNNDDCVINGTKLFVSDANIADYIICVTRTKETENPEEGITIIIVDAKTPGISLTPLKTIARDKLCEVVFDNVTVPKENILGEEHKGWAGASAIQETAATAKCFDIVGSLQKVFEITIEYAKERNAFGQPIGSFQAVQHHCANMATDINGAMLSAYQAAWKISEGLPGTWEVAVAKAWASKVSPRVMALAHQIHGAIGTTMDHDLHYYTRRTKAAESAFGDTDFYQRLVAREIERGS